MNGVCMGTPAQVRVIRFDGMTTGGRRVSKKNDEAVTGRRDFLKLATVGAPAAVAATVATGGQALAAEPTELGYTETPHVKAYLDSCRF